MSTPKQPCPNCGHEIGALLYCTPLKEDEYFGKTANAAVQLVLDRYKALGKAPVDIEDILKTLNEGRYKFTTDAKGQRNSLYVMLSKNTKYFVRMPNGKFGLCKWYDNVPRKTKTKKTDGAGTVEAELENASPDIEGDEPEGGDDA